MKKGISASTRIVLTPREMFFIGSVLISLATMYYKLESDIEEAKLLPRPEVTVDYIDLQHQAVMAEVSLAKEEICFVKDNVSEMKDVIKTLDRRIYEIYTSTLRTEAYQDDLITYHNELRFNDSTQ